MKNAIKILERKRKIIVVLVVMVSFVSVLAWYQMKKAHAYQSYNTGGNKHFKDGHLTVNINGPNGKSDSLTKYIHSDEYEKNNIFFYRCLLRYVCNCCISGMAKWRCG